MNIPDFKSYRLSAAELNGKISELLSEKGCGFYRMADSEAVVVLKDCAFPVLAEANGTFLFEAVFYIEGKYSFSIRQYNDFWLFNQVSWNYLPPEKSAGTDEFKISTQYMADGTPLRFYTQYLPEKCCDFTTLRPAWTVFTGFVKGE